MAHYAVTVRARLRESQHRVRGHYVAVIVALEDDRPMPLTMVDVMAQTIAHDNLVIAGMHGLIVDLTSVSICKLDDAECVHENLTRHKLFVAHMEDRNNGG